MTGLPSLFENSSKVCRNAMTYLLLQIYQEIEVSHFGELVIQVVRDKREHIILSSLYPIFLILLMFLIPFNHSVFVFLPFCFISHYLLIISTIPSYKQSYFIMIVLLIFYIII